MGFGDAGSTMRLMIYSHDTFGLGNIRRILALCKHLQESCPDISILVVSGSPMLHSFRIPEEMDYIKLPCLKRSGSGDLKVRTLNIELTDAVKLRSAIIRAAVENFKPDVLLVDKKPAGLAGELIAGLRHLKVYSPAARILLVLRDILDRPETTINNWKRQAFYETIELYYDRVLIFGDPRIFDAIKEYQVPEIIQNRVSFCGYIGRKLEHGDRENLRKKLNVSEREKLVLVTTGGGEDGYHLIETYLTAIQRKMQAANVRTVVITGPELSASRREKVRELAHASNSVQLLEFTSQMMRYLAAADVVVSMAGYNTVCELLSLGKRAVLIPRVAPVEEQLIRAKLLSDRSIFPMIHPAQLNPELLMRAVEAQLDSLDTPLATDGVVDLNGLEYFTRMVQSWTDANHSDSPAGMDNHTPVQQA